MTESSLEHFEQLDIKKPADLIIEQLRALIASGTLKPETKLPSERALADKFGVGRGYIREAIQKLEFYGLLKTIPKKGTVVASLGVKSLEGLIANLLTLDHGDMESLMETRAVLEIHTARMAAVRGEAEDFREIRRSHEEYKAKALKGLPALDEDHVFHLAVARAAKNSITNSLIGLIIPDVIAMNRDFLEDEADRFIRTIAEHEEVIRALFERKPDEAAKAMRYHMEMAHRRRFSGKDPRWTSGFEENRSNPRTRHALPKGH